MTLTVISEGPVDYIHVQTGAQFPRGKSVNLDELIQELIKVRGERLSTSGNRGPIDLVFAVEGNPGFYTNYCISDGSVSDAPIILRISD